MLSFALISSDFIIIIPLLGVFVPWRGASRRIPFTRVALTLALTVSKLERRKNAKKYAPPAKMVIPKFAVRFTCVASNLFPSEMSLSR